MSNKSKHFEATTKNSNWPFFSSTRFEDVIDKATTAFQKCTPALKEGVQEMLKILTDPKSDKQERAMALGTITETLFPGLAGRKTSEEKRVEQYWQ